MDDVARQCGGVGEIFVPILFHHNVLDVFLRRENVAPKALRGVVRLWRRFLCHF